MEKCARCKEADYVINVCATIGEYEGIKDKKKKTKLQECPNSEKKEKNLILAESGNVFGVTPRPVKGADIKWKNKPRFFFEIVTY